MEGNLHSTKSAHVNVISFHAFHFRFFFFPFHIWKGGGVNPYPWNVCVYSKKILKTFTFLPPSWTAPSPSLKQKYQKLFIFLFFIFELPFFSHFIVVVVVQSSPPPPQNRDHLVKRPFVNGVVFFFILTSFFFCKFLHRLGSYPFYSACVCVFFKE